MKALHCHHVTTYCPSFISIHDPTLPLNEEEQRIFHRFLGYERIAATKEKSMAHHLKSLLQSSLDEKSRSVSEIDLLIHVHTHQEASPFKAPHLITLRQHFPTLNCPCFGISIHNCVSFFTAIQIIQTQFQNKANAFAVILAGDIVHTPFQRIMPRTAIMGEGMTATWLSLQPSPHRLLAVAQETHGQYAKHMHHICDPMTNFEKAYPKHMQAVIESCLAKANLSWQDIDIVLPHNVSRFSWQRFSAWMGLSEDLFFLDNIGRYGHCFNADPTLNWSAIDFQSRMPQGGHYLMVGVGLGATFAAAAWRYEP